MNVFAVTREAGPGWTEGKGAFEQPGAGDHATFMAELAGQGLVLLAGPLAGSENHRIRVLLVADTADPAEVRRRLADDPWEHAHRLVTTSIEPWTVLVGREALGRDALGRDALGREALGTSAAGGPNGRVARATRSPR